MTTPTPNDARRAPGLAAVALLFAVLAAIGGSKGYAGGYVAAAVFALAAGALWFGWFGRVGDWMANRKP